MRRARLLSFLLLIHVCIGIYAQDNILTIEGLGPVKLGQTLDKIPDTYPGLYASKGMERDETVFYDQNKQEVFRAFIGEDKLVNLIAVVSPNIRTSEGAHVGMTKKEIEGIAGAIYIQPHPYADFPRDSYELFGVFLLMDFEDQGIVTEMTVTKEENWVSNAVGKHKKLHIGIMDIFQTARSFRNLLKYIPEIKKLEHVKDVYYNGENTIFVETDDIGTVSYSFFPKHDNIKSVDWNKLQAELEKITGANPDMFKYDDVVIAFQPNSDMRLNEVESHSINFTKLMFEKSGSGNVTEAFPTMKFFLNDIFNHTLVLLETHGCYDSTKKVHWLATSDIITDHEKAFKEYEHFIKEGMISIGYACKEEQSKGIVTSVPYFNISEKLIASARNQFKYRAPVLIYNSACCSMQENDNLALAFRNKGAYFYLGYDKTNNMWGYTGIQFFSRLLSGMTVEGALMSLDNSVVNNKSITPDNEPIDATLKWSPTKEDGVPYNNIKDYIFVKPDWQKERTFSVSDKPIKYHIKPGEGKADIEGTDYFMHITYTAKIPLFWFKHPDNVFLHNENGNLSKIPLEYGFQLCKDDNFIDYITITAPINNPVTQNDVDSGHRFWLMNAEYKDYMVTFSVDFNGPMNNQFWNNNMLRCYIRPVIYDKNTKVTIFGAKRLVYMPGGPSDPNLKIKR